MCLGFRGRWRTGGTLGEGDPPLEGEAGDSGPGRRFPSPRVNLSWSSKIMNRD